MRVLVVNAGSSSLKLSLLDDEDALLGQESLPAGDSGVERHELEQALKAPLAGAQAVGHRIVHGGPDFDGPVEIDGQVRGRLQALIELAPLHQPHSLRGLDAVAELLPELPAVACFDTTFHASMPPAASTYALPARWRERWGLRRYGFHGLSHAYVARRAPELTGQDQRDLRIVSAHLGAGASLCAIRDGRSQDTTMGFTPLEGLVMATRSGSVDPGMLLWLIDRGRLSPHELSEALEHESGLLALGGSAEMAEITSRALAGESDSTLALDVYVHRLSTSIAAMAAAIGGLDVLAFTGGVGEHSAEVRDRTAAALEFLGVQIDERANTRGKGDRDLSSAGSAAGTVVVRAREDLEIATQTRAVLGARSTVG